MTARRARDIEIFGICAYLPKPTDVECCRLLLAAERVPMAEEKKKPEKSPMGYGGGGDY